MKRTVFYVVLQRIDYKFKYTAGFKNHVDAELYVDKFGGAVETISCTFYKDFAEAESQVDLVNKSNLSIRNIIQDFNEMSEEEKIMSKAHNAEIIKELMEFL